MRLHDLIMQSNAAVQVELPGYGEFRLPGAGARADLLAATPLRYVLDDKVRSLCTKIISDWPELLNPHDLSLRLPVERLWMEWFRPATSIVIGSQPQRCGLLVEADATGRNGRIESFWEDPTFGADRAQVSIEFDLDRPLGMRTAGTLHFPFPSGCDPTLAAHARICVDPGWADYFTFTSARHRPLAQIVDMCADNVWRDLPMLLSFCRLLASKPEIDVVAVDRAKLNRVRARSGKLALLDHLELHLNVGDELAVGRAGTATVRRAAARMHLVRGHMVNRHGQLFWRSSHLRGRPEKLPIQSKTFTVSLGHDPL